MLIRRFHYGTRHLAHRQIKAAATGMVGIQGCWLDDKQQMRLRRRQLGDPKIAEHSGRIVKTTGDGLLVEFASVGDAVRCAVEVQREMITRNAAVPAERRIEFRMGINARH